MYQNSEVKILNHKVYQITFSFKFVQAYSILILMSLAYGLKKKYI